MVMLRALLPLAAVLSVLAAVRADDAVDTSDVFALDDASFETTTQAASGATTGHWFVMFYAPWCGWCKKLKPDFEAVAAELQGDVVFGKVDCDSAYLTCSRFEVRGFPTMVMLVQGKAYTYRGPRTREALIEFATGGFREAEGVIIEPEPNVVVQYLRMILREVKALAEEDAYLMFLVVAGGVLLGISVVVVLLYFFSSPAPDPKLTRRVVDRAAQQQAAKEKKAN